MRTGHSSEEGRPVLEDRFSGEDDIRSDVSHLDGSKPASDEERYGG